MAKRMELPLLWVSWCVGQELELSCASATDRPIGTFPVWRCGESAVEAPSWSSAERSWADTFQHRHMSVRTLSETAESVSRGETVKQPGRFQA